MNAQRTCTALAILTLCGCASVPETETPEGKEEKTPGWHITGTDEGKEHTVDQRDEQKQWIDSEESTEWVLYICSLPAGPEREKQLVTARERKLDVYCPDNQQKRTQ
jgi:hypothetical protein